jgi:hypothetical protein
VNRRQLIAGAASMAAAAIRALHAETRGAEVQAAGFAPKRSGPSTPLVLRSAELQVVFDLHHAVPYSYRYKNQLLTGDSQGGTPRAIICQLHPRAYRTVPIQVLDAQQSSDSISFAVRVDSAGHQAAAFHLHYTIENSSLVLTMESIEEQAGFELIEMALPHLVSVHEADGSAWMAEGRNGGSFVRLEAAKAYRFEDSDYFGRISTELPIGMVGQHGIACVMEVTAFMDGTETEIKGGVGNRRAILGTVQVHRVHGGRCYHMNDGGNPICGNSNTPNLLVEQSSRVRFDFFSYAGEAQPWLIGSKIVRSRVPASPTHFFSDRFLYIVAGKNKTEDKPKTTFAQSRQLIRDVALLTDYAPQTVFISGWVYDGQDTGYPSEDKINESLGNYEELRELIDAGKRLNANVTLNVNYDDAYKSSPIFNEAFIARRPDGAVWKSRVWDGEDSYIVGMAKFVEGGWADRRISYTMNRYKIKDSILIDAMSWFAVRNDWDLQHPASGYKNLVDGKYRVVEKFKEGGIAVTSEQFRYPFVGKLAESMDGPGVSECPFGGEAVPLVASVFRGAAIWGTNGETFRDPGQQLFWNTRSALWFQADTDRTRIADFYYLVVLPYSKLHAFSVERYESEGAVRRVLLERHSSVSLDTKTGSYTAELDGLTISRDNATTCPIDEHRIAFYAKTAQKLTYPLPAGWTAASVKARALTIQGDDVHEVECVEGKIVVEVMAHQPVIVYSGEDARSRALAAQIDTAGE